MMIGLKQNSLLGVVNFTKGPQQDINVGIFNQKLSNRNSHYFINLFFFKQPAFIISTPKNTSYSIRKPFHLSKYALAHRPKTFASKKKQPKQQYLLLAM